MDILYTVGHSQHTIDYFVKLLKLYGINYVLDVRSTPYSKYAEQFNRESIYEYLKKTEINYSYMGDFFGARLDDTYLYNDSGCLDFEKVIKSDKFCRGMDNVILGLERGNKIALMCTEKDPIDCHRAIMVARGFSLNGIEVEHILQNGKLQSQKELDYRLLEKYFPDREQITLFSNSNYMCEEDYLAGAYHKRNLEIGYYVTRKEIVAI